MTPSTVLQFSEDDTRESALQKANAWYDEIAKQSVTNFALAIGWADISDEQKIAGLDQARITAEEARAPFLAQIADVLDALVAAPRSH